MPRKSNVRRICFVTGTRAEFGLMDSTLRAIQSTPGLQLQIVATGMHLDPRHSDGIKNWPINATVPWRHADRADATAARTGEVMAGLATTFEKLQSDIVLVVGDRVEAFAAAAAAHISGRIVAHVHGGDRALGQVDDVLRHAITKLAHLHFPATAQSAERIVKLGEDRWRIQRCGSPGIDGIRKAAGRRIIGEPFALLVLHPTDADERVEEHRAAAILATLSKFQKGDKPLFRLIVIGSNNDPGARGIERAWRRAGSSIEFHKDIPRPQFLSLLRDAAFLIGNSSSGIIEAASFGTPVIDVGDRQKGRERSENVTNVSFRQDAIAQAIARIWRDGRPIRFPRRNVYGGDGAGRKIARALATVALDDRLARKLIAY